MLTLVTGATGLLGNNLVRMLLARGDRVRVLVRRSSDPRPLEGLSVERFVGDLRDARSLTRAFTGVEQVYHAAAHVQIGRRDYAYHRLVNAKGAGVVARAAREAGARLLHVSSVDALAWGTREDPADEYREPTDDSWIPYVATKRQGDKLVLAELDFGLHAVIVHPAYMLGPWDWKPSTGRLLLAVARGRGRVAPPGGMDFVHVEDVARGVLAAAELGVNGERFILGGEALGFREAFELFARVSGGPPPRSTGKPGLIKLAGFGGDLVSLFRRKETEINSASALMGLTEHHFDDGKARQMLAYESRPAESAARDAWAWFKAFGYA
jgi:dihydroflavonol-4-reductase